MDKSSGLERINEELEARVSDLIVERDTLATLAEKYKENFTVLSTAYAAANAHLTQAVQLSESLTEQYRDIARDRAESITHLLHGNRTAAGNMVGAHEGSVDHSRVSKLENVINRRERKLNSGVKNLTFSAARLLTGFSDGRFPEVNPPADLNMSYEAKLEYLAHIDRELTRLMSSRAYLLRARFAESLGKTSKPNRGSNK